MASYFVDWLIENVHLVEITAYSDEDAHTIFATMNDLGLSLTPTDMLKGYLLANINEPEVRTKATRDWKNGWESFKGLERKKKRMESRLGCAANMPRASGNERPVQSRETSI